jgi:hypothetical protein
MDRSLWMFGDEDFDRLEVLMSDRQQDQEAIHEISSQRSEFGVTGSPTEETPFPATTLPFRLIADFAVETKSATEYLQQPDLTQQERDLFLTVLHTPEALNRMCRLAIVSDFEADLDGCFHDIFLGPHPEDILDCVLPYLPAELANYWKELRERNYDRFSHWIDEIFMEFHSSLKRTVIEDMTTGETIPLQVGSRCGSAR